VAAAGRDPGAAGHGAAGADGADGFRVPYALETLIDEVTMPPVLVQDGRAEEIEPMRPGGTVSYPEPVGEAEAIHTLHSELRTFPESFGCRAASFRLSLEPALLERLRGMASASREEVEAAGASVRRPLPSTVSVHLVEADAGARTVRVSAVTRPMPEWGLGGGIVSAAPAAAAVRLLARGRLAAAGALPPERCVAPGDLFPELERRSCTFAVETVERTSA